MINDCRVTESFALRTHHMIRPEHTPIIVSRKCCRRSGQKMEGGPHAVRICANSIGSSGRIRRGCGSDTPAQEARWGHGEVQKSDVAAGGQGRKAPETADAKTGSSCRRGPPSAHGRTMRNKNGASGYRLPIPTPAKLNAHQVN